MIGVVGYDRIVQQNRDENTALIEQSVSSAIAALPQGSGAAVDTEALINSAVATAIAAVPGNAAADVVDPNKRYDVSVVNQPRSVPKTRPS